MAWSIEDLKAKPVLLVAGVTGKDAKRLNGWYDLIENKFQSGRAPVYGKSGKSDTWLYFVSAGAQRGKWAMGDEEHMSKRKSWGATFGMIGISDVPAGTMPNKIEKWEVWSHDREEWVEKNGICITVMTESEADKKKWMLIYDKVSKNSVVKLSGITGPHRKLLNGIYQLQTHHRRCSAPPVYGKSGKDDVWLYWAKDSSWCFGSYACRKMRTGEVTADDEVLLSSNPEEEAGSLPDEVEGWFMKMGEKWIDDHPNLREMKITVEEPDDASESDHSSSDIECSPSETVLQDDFGPVPKDVKLVPQLFDKAKHFFRSDSRIDAKAARQLLQVALDDDVMSQCERATLEYIRDHMKPTPEAARIIEGELHKALEAEEHEEDAEDHWKGATRLRICFSVHESRMNASVEKATQILLQLLAKGTGIGIFSGLAEPGPTGPTLKDQIEVQLRNEKAQDGIEIAQVYEESLTLVAISIDKSISDMKFGWSPLMWCQKYEMKLEGFALVLKAENEAAFNLCKAHIKRKCTEGLDELHQAQKRRKRF